MDIAPFSRSDVCEQSAARGGFGTEGTRITVGEFAKVEIADGNYEHSLKKIKGDVKVIFTALICNSSSEPRQNLHRRFTDH